MAKMPADFLATVKSWPETQDSICLNGTKPDEQRTMRTTMKKRWMKSVIETSKQQMPALPYQRDVRRAASAASVTGTRRKVRIA